MHNMQCHLYLVSPQKSILPPNATNRQRGKTKILKRKKKSKRNKMNLQGNKKIRKQTLKCIHTIYKYTTKNKPTPQNHDIFLKNPAPHWLASMVVPVLACEIRLAYMVTNRSCVVLSLSKYGKNAFPSII